MNEESGARSDSPQSPPATAVHPYGPATPNVRRFLVQFAGLGAETRRAVLARHATVVDTPAYVAAERLIGETIERSGRTDARDALAGPLMQLVRATDANIPGDDALAMLDPIAEPALAMLLALLVADLVPAAAVDVLCSPFASVLSV